MKTLLHKWLSAYPLSSADGVGVGSGMRVDSDDMGVVFGHDGHFSFFLPVGQ